MKNFKAAMAAKLREAKEAKKQAAADAAAKAVLANARKAAEAANIFKNQLGKKVEYWTKQVAEGKKEDDAGKVRKAEAVLKNLKKQLGGQEEADK